MLEPQVFCIYCDDVRHEVSGKITFVGCYGSEMFVPSFPFTLDKFGLSISLRLPYDLDVEGPIKLSVLANDAPIAEMEIQIGEIKLPAPSHNLGEITEKNFGGILQMKNLELKEPTLMIAAANINGKEYYGPKLRIMLRNEEE